MSEVTDHEIDVFLAIVQRSLATIAREVYTAWSDNKITRMEAFSLALQAFPAVMPIPGAFGDLSQEAISQLVDELNGKDLVFKPREQ